jgi:hypothetical protein
MRSRVLYPSGPFVPMGVSMEFHGGVLADVTFGGVDLNGPWSEADQRLEVMGKPGTGLRTRRGQLMGCVDYIDSYGECYVKKIMGSARKHIIQVKHSNTSCGTLLMHPLCSLLILYAAFKSFASKSSPN